MKTFLINKIRITAKDNIEAVKKYKQIMAADIKTSDFFEPISSFKSWQFTDKTKQGYKIVSMFEDVSDNRLHIIAKRSSDYFIGLGYSPDDGTWNQGRYDFGSYEDAEKALRKEKKIKRYVHDSVNDALVNDNVSNEKDAIKKFKTVNDSYFKWYTDGENDIAQSIAKAYNIKYIQLDEYNCKLVGPRKVLEEMIKNEFSEGDIDYAINRIRDSKSVKDDDNAVYVLNEVMDHLVKASVIMYNFSKKYNLDNAPYKAFTDSLEKTQNAVNFIIRGIDKVIHDNCSSVDDGVMSERQSGEYKNGFLRVMTKSAYEKAVRNGRLSETGELFHSLEAAKKYISYLKSDEEYVIVNLINNVVIKYDN